MSTSPSNFFSKVPAELEEELVETLAKSECSRIERIVSQGHSSPPGFWYDQIETEWVMLLRGEAILEFEEKEDVHLKPGSYLTIPPHTKHRVKWTASGVDTFWIAVHYKNSL